MTPPVTALVLAELAERLVWVAKGWGVPLEAVIGMLRITWAAVEPSDTIEHSTVKLSDYALARLTKELDFK